MVVADIDGDESSLQLAEKFDDDVMVRLDRGEFEMRRFHFQRSGSLPADAAWDTTHQPEEECLVSSLFACATRDDIS